MAYLRLAEAGASVRSLPIVLQDLSFSVPSYTQIKIICSDGQYFYATSGGGSTSAGFYTTPIYFNYLRPNTQYGFRAETIYGGGKRNIPASGWTYFRTLPEPTVSVGNVTGVGSYGVSTNSFSVYWNSASNATGYNFQYRRGGGSWSTLYTSSTSISVGGLSADSYYEYRIQAYNGSTTGSWTSVYGVWTQGITVGSVTGLQHYATTKNSFSLTWNSASNASSYQVQYKPSTSSSWTSTYTSYTSITITGLQAGTYYNYRVRGYTGSTYGDFTGSFLVRTEAASPTPLNFPTFYTGNGFSMTAKQWNDLTAKINAWREHKKLSQYTFTTALRGGVLSANMFNQAVNALSPMYPPIVPPGTVSAGSPLYAGHVNRLANSIDSLT